MFIGLVSSTTMNNWHRRRRNILLKRYYSNMVGCWCRNECDVGYSSCDCCGSGAEDDDGSTELKSWKVDAVKSSDCCAGVMDDVEDWLLILSSFWQSTCRNLSANNGDMDINKFSTVSKGWFIYPSIVFVACSAAGPQKSADCETTYATIQQWTSLIHTISHLFTLYPCWLTSIITMTPSNNVRSTRPNPMASSRWKAVADPGTMPWVTLEYWQVQ